uniref:Secreted protein n=1 Tax=Oryza rufipogon TaxID=4529 RepID=A0A0E0QUH1_ORYRU
MNPLIFLLLSLLHPTHSQPQGTNKPRRSQPTNQPTNHRRRVGRPRPVLLRERPAPHHRVPPCVRVVGAADRADAFASTRDDTRVPTSPERDEEAEKAKKPPRSHAALPPRPGQLAEK